MKQNKGARSNWQKQVLSVLGSLHGEIAGARTETTDKVQRSGQTLYQKVDTAEGLQRTTIETLRKVKRTSVLIVLILSLVLLNEILRYFIR